MADQKSLESVIKDLSDRVNFLSKGFSKLTKYSSLKDIGEQALKIIQELFPAYSITIAHCVTGKSDWEMITRNESSNSVKFKSIPVNTLTDALSILDDSCGIDLIQKLSDNSFIRIALSNKSPDRKYSELDLTSLRIFGQLLDNAYSSMISHKNQKELIFSLNHRILQLNSLIETGIEVEKLDQSSSPHRLALIRAASLTNASCAALRVTSGDIIREEYFFPESINNHPSPENTNRITTNFTFREDLYTFELFNKESRKGNIAFEETDQLLLDALAKQVYASLENRFLHQQAIEKQLFEQEMSVAATIQKKIIPVTLPVIAGYDLAGVNIPSKSVGGDYFDCIPLKDGRFILIIADVAGKGVPAALLVSSLHAYLAAYSEGSFTLSELTTRLNRVIYMASTDDKFITAFIVNLNPKTGGLEYINAGHNPAYVFTRNKKIKVLKGNGLPLGMFTKMEYSCNCIKMNHGERLLLYTDGVTEAQNDSEEFFEDKKPLDKYFSKDRSKTAEAFISKLITDIKAFTGSAPQTDDITAMSLWRR